jgi:hypothetical protein
MKVKKFQVGGSAPAEQTAPAEGQGANPQEQLAQMAQQIVQQLGPEAASALAQMIMQLLQGAAQEGQQPEGQPTYQRQGGKLVLIGRR